MAVTPSGVVLVEQYNVRHFSSSDELMHYQMQFASPFQLMDVLKSKAGEFAGNPTLTDQLVAFAKQIVAECVAKKLSEQPDKVKP